MRGRRHKLQVSTFPFLAVLLCAMGSLILVLLVMDRKAHRAAQARSQREAARLADERAQAEGARRAERERLRLQALAAQEEKRDVLHARLTDAQAQVQAQVREVREQLRDIAARLRYEQDTSTELRRKVQDERGRLQAEEQLLLSLRSGAAAAARQSQQSGQALRRMTIDLLQMEQALKDLRASRQREQKTFSVVPYHGRRGENRRPIYVECTAEGVIFHPEKRAMPVVSRAFSPGGDAPDDVRGEVERRIARQRARLAALPGNVDRTPYLLLLLRPDGVETYHLFQAALKGLPIDFGYEFIDADWVLDFPTDDEQPSSQPWMMATRPPAAPLPSGPPGAPRSHPAALEAGGSAAGGEGLRGFHGAEGGGSGRWVRGPVAGGTGGDGTGSSGGTGPAMPGAARGGGGAAYAGSGGGNVFGGGSAPAGAAANLGAGGGAGSGGGWGVGLGQGGRGGHPAALAPSWGGGEGGGPGGEADPPAPGFRGSGGFSLRGGGNASGSGTGYGDSPGDPGDGTPGLGPPRVLASSSPGAGAPGRGNGTAGLGPPGGRTGWPVIGSSEANVSGPRGYGSGPLRGVALGGGSAPGGLSTPGVPGVGYVPGGGGMTAIASSGMNKPGGVRGGNGGGDGSGPSPAGGAPGGGQAAGGSAPGGAAGTGASGVGSGADPPGTGRNGIGGGGNGNPGQGGVVQGSPGGGTARGPGGGTAPGASDGPNSNTPGGAGGTASAADVAGRGGATGAPPGSTGRPPRIGADAYGVADPLMPQPTNVPSEDASAERPPDEPNRRSRPRGRILGGGGGGGDGDPDEAAVNRYAPRTADQPRRPPPALRPAWVHGGRDWTIYLECRAGAVVLYPSGRTFAADQAAAPAEYNPLIGAVRQMIERRQAARRPDEPPYRPQLTLLVRPDALRTFLSVYPALEALPVPKTRQNLEPDDDVAAIVTGANP